MDKTIIKKIEDFFENHQEYVNCFITSDGQLFHNRKLAGDHSQWLDDGQIYHVSRGTNLEDWYEDTKQHERVANEAHEEFKSQELESPPKWGWWNWLYKILH